MAIRKIIKRATDALFTNPEFDGTEAARQVKGTTLERASAEAGDLRFNTTTTLMEYYDGTQWKSIDSPPTVSSISPSTESDPNANIVITGSNFASSVTVKFVGNDGTEYPSPSVTRDSNTQITATTPATALSVANEPYDVVVTNVNSSLAGTLADALDAGGVPAFNTTAGTYTIYDVERATYSFDAGAVDPDGDTITYSISAGSLPSGASINSSTGAITGFSAVGSNTTSTFTVSAATGSGDTSTRQFSIVVSAPVVTSYTSVGSGTFSVPSGISAVDVLVVAGGGGGGRAGGGGAGGLIFRPAMPVTPGGSVSYTVGNGGQGNWTDTATGQNGQDSVFGGLTAKGGGWGSYSQQQANPGGSGGGGGFNNGGFTDWGGQGIQPQQPGDSGTYGFGNKGGRGGPSPQAGPGNTGGGGGGAGAVGGEPNQGSPDNWAPGGVGKQYDISGSQVYYAGGGTGAGHAGGNSGPQGRPQGGGGLAYRETPYPQAYGEANRGGGGGGIHHPSDNTSTNGKSENRGGSGIVIVKY